MRIIQLLPNLNEGGVERGAVDSNREYVKRGHESIVISNGGRLCEQIVKDGGEHIAFDVASKNILSAPWRVYRLKQLLKELKPDVIHARSRVPAWLVYLANKKLNIPFVTTVHGFNSVNAYSRVMTHGDRVICSSRFLIEHIKEHYGVADDIIRLIPRGIDLEYFDPNRLDIPWRDSFVERYNLSGKKIIVQVARITGWKDQLTTIKAFFATKEKHPTLVLLLVGSVDKSRESYYGELASVIEGSKWRDDVIFTGNQSNIKEIFSLAALNISSSTKPETFGRANVEGMVMGVPLLASSIGAAFDYVQEGKTGFFFNPGDYRELSKLVEKSIEYKFDHAYIRNFAQTNFSLKQMIDKTIEVYEEVV